MFFGIKKPTIVHRQISTVNRMNNPWLLFFNISFTFALYLPIEGIRSTSCLDIQLTNGFYFVASKVDSERALGYHHWLVLWNMNFIFPYIGNVIIPTATNSIIFQRGGSTTNQISIPIQMGKHLTVAVERWNIPIWGDLPMLLVNLASIHPIYIYIYKYVCIYIYIYIIYIYIYICDMYIHTWGYGIYSPATSGTWIGGTYHI